MPRGQPENPVIDWQENTTPRSQRFDDPYFSAQDGLAETRHVFLAGNRLPDRFRPGFHIAELGFGTGLNMLATWQSWRDSGMSGQLHFTSFEAYPLAAPDLERALVNFPELQDLTAEFLPRWAAGQTRFQLGSVQIEIIIGDANQTLANWPGRADAWFLDGFSPAKNPELWNPELMSSVAAHTTPDGTFATYSAAGHIRRSLSEVGFRTDRIPGFGTKRHMSIGTLKERP